MSKQFSIESRLSKLPKYLGVEPVEWLSIEADEDIQNDRFIWCVRYTNTAWVEYDEDLAKALDKLYRTLLRKGII